MRKSYDQLRADISMDGKVDELREFFDRIPDHRAANVSYSLSDVLMSGFAMFSLKHPSLLDFEQQSVCDKKNLHTVFGIQRLCTDALMRNILDQVNPEALWPAFTSQFKGLESLGLIQEYEFWQNHILLSIDAVEHFRSSKIHCDHCQKKTGRDGVASYSHSMLCAAVVHPDKFE
jgi:hypothetical protein